MCRHCSFQGTSIIVGMLGVTVPLIDLMRHSGKYRICNDDHHHLHIMTLHVRHIKGTRTLTDIKNIYRLQKRPVHCPCWERQGWQKLKQHIHILLTFFLPFVCMEIYKKEIWSWAKAWFHWVPHSSPTGKITVLKKKRDPDCPARSSSLVSHAQMETRTHVRMYSKEVLI